MIMKDIKTIVKDGYARVVRNKSSCCAPHIACCGSGDPAKDISKKIGYTDTDLKAVPNGANLGLGCGNPIALASLREGETVLDLGSGAGFDVFLAAARVGKTGKVIGVDMTPEMIAKAKENAAKGNYGNVEFRLGEIEKLPVDRDSVDVVISNCVINLSPDKRTVFQEAFRTLKPGGRLMVSDIVLLKELPEGITNSVEAYVGCLSGAIMKAEYMEAIKEAGFQEVRILDETSFPVDCMANDPTAQAVIEDFNMSPTQVNEIAGSVASMNVQAVKPI